MAAAAAHEAFGLLWPFRILPHQDAGIERLLREPSVLLADEMGLGKTIQAVAALRILVRQGEARTAMIVCPAGIVLQWRRQARQWAPDLALSTVIGSSAQRRAAWGAPAQIYVTSYEALRSDLSIRQPFGPGQRDWDVVVIDEAQRIKNPQADIAIAVKRLKRARAWALTGTPIENRLDDLVSILDFVAPGRFRPGMMAVGLRRLLAEVQLRRRREEVLPDLPPKLLTMIDVELTRRQRASYRRAHDEGLVKLKALGRELRISHVLELILRLKQICNACPETGESAKLADLRGRLTALARGEKALVFSQFVEPPFGARWIARELAGWNPVLLTGDLDAAARAARVAEFERDPARRAMVLSLRAGGVGLNLTAASCVVHFDRWWNPALESQAEDRAHRIGQTRPVQVFAYLCDETVEQRIDEILSEKRALFADVIDGVGVRALHRLDLDTLLDALHARRW